MTLEDRAQAEMHWGPSSEMHHEFMIESRAQKCIESRAQIYIEGRAEGQQPHCLNSLENQVWIAKERKVENQKFDSEEHGFFGVTKEKVPGVSE